jgi:hypothetical protein
MKTLQFDNARAEIHPAHAHVFAGGDLPVVTYYTAEDRWAPFDAEYNQDGRQVTKITRGDAAARIGAWEAFAMLVESSARSALAASRRETKAREAVGRRAWAATSQDERDSLNDYAMKTEGHTID